MENKERINGKEALKQWLNFRLTCGRNDVEVISTEKLDLLLEELNQKERDPKAIQGVTPKRLAMFNSIYGLDGTNEMKTYEEVAKMFDNTSEIRVRQAVEQVIREIISYYKREEFYKKYSDEENYTKTLKK